MELHAQENAQHIVQAVIATEPIHHDGTLRSALDTRDELSEDVTYQQGAGGLGLRDLESNRCVLEKQPQLTLIKTNPVFKTFQFFHPQLTQESKHYK